MWEAKAGAATVIATAAIVIAKYEQGLAYVQSWEAFVSRESRGSAAEGNK